MAHTPTELPEQTRRFVELEDRYGAHNYKPLPVVIAQASGAWVQDVEGKRYLDWVQQQTLKPSKMMPGDSPSVAPMNKP